MLNPEETEVDASPRRRTPSRRSGQPSRRRAPERAPGVEPRGPVPDLFLVCMIALTIAKSMLARSIAIDPAVAVYGLWLDAGIAILLLGAAALAFRKRSHLLMLGVYSVYSFLLFGDAIYAKFFDQMLDPQMIGLAGQAGEVGDIIVDLLKPVYLWFFIDIPLFAFWAVLLRRRHAVYGRLGVVIATPVALLIVIVQVAMVAMAPAGTDSATTSTQWGITSMQFASLEGMMFPREKHAFADMATASAVAGSKVSTETAAQQSMRLFNSRMGEFAPTGGTRIAPFPEGVCKGKNVIIIEFESLQRMFINAKVNGQYVTPNVNRFLKDSYDFPNAYSQSGIGNTADTEFTLATSMLPPLQQNATSAYSDRVLPALPRKLTAMGYRTFTLHTNAAHFWFRKDLYAALDYQKYYDKDYFKDRDLMWRGSSDEVLFEDGTKAIKNELKGGKPILATFVTMTSHVGYNYPMGQTRRPLKLPLKYANSYAGKYAGAISYADKAFGEFIDDLKAAHLYDDTVIVLIGDHMGYKIEDPSSTDDAIIRQMLGRDLSWVDHQRTTFAVHVPHQKPAVVKSMRAVQDIMPTVADLVGADISTTPHFGRSAFVEGPRLVPFRAYFPGGSYVDNNMVFVAGATEGENKAFDIHTNKQITPPSKQDSKIAMVRQFNALSDDWLMSLPIREGGVNRRKDAASGDEGE